MRTRVCTVFEVYITWQSLVNPVGTGVIPRRVSPQGILYLNSCIEHIHGFFLDKTGFYQSKTKSGQQGD